jgi:hypothetical protein
MKRLARLARTAGVTFGLSAVLVGQAAFATPFSDVPANHWAYQYIQSLAADGIIDGYPDGKFKGDRPLTRYEMAVVVARVIAKLQDSQKPYNGPSKEDLDKLQKLIDSLKDELDSLGVRVTNLEDALDALDKRTKFAQSLSLHGTFLPNVTLRQRNTFSRTIVNGTGAAQPVWYNAGSPTNPQGAGQSGTGLGSIGSGATGSTDAFSNAFMASDDSNNPFTQANSGIQIRQDSRFTLAYAITDNLTISLPVHILNFEYGGEFTQQAKYNIDPGIDINIAKAGALQNLHFKFGILDDMKNSRTGLAFRAPLGYNGAVPYDLPYQPYTHGVSVSGSILGLTDFYASFSRLDDTLIDTQPGATDPSVLPLQANTYFFPVQPPQEGYTQTSAAQALRTDTFNTGTSPLTQVYLTNSAVLGSVYISSYNGTTYNSAGVATGGGGIAAPAFTYDQAYNSVVFGTPLPAGSVIQITYRAQGTSNNVQAQRYLITARINQKFKGLPGTEIGVSFNRIFDFDDSETSGSQTFINQNPVTGYGLVSDTVFGVDGQFTVPYNISGPGSAPVLYGEFADSKFTADYRNVPAVGDTAFVVGGRLKISKLELSAQYQSVGADFFSGAPQRYYGNVPSNFFYSKLGYIPGFIGFGNDLGINQQFDSQFTNIGLVGPRTSLNPALSYIAPIFNPLGTATGTNFYSAFTPNSRGEVFTAAAPIPVGDITFATRASYSHLEEIRPNSYGQLVYGPAFASSVRAKDDLYSLGTSFGLPAFGQKLTADLSANYEVLKRNDTTAFAYVPYNLLSQSNDAASTAALAAIPGGGSLVNFYPNYVNIKKIQINAAASLPLTQNVGLRLSYSTQRYGGSYGTTLTQSISEKKDYYTGTVTYSIPKTNSSINFQARQYRYTDDVISNANLNQNRQDINFVVRF